MATTTSTSTEGAHDPLLGTLLGEKYRLQRVLADGGTGRVYRAVQEPLGRAVALKLMHLNQGQGSAADRFAERFFREAAAAGQLRHPNVVTVFDVGWLGDGRCFIVMELLDGQSFAELLRRGPMPTDLTVEIFSQIIRGVRHAHRAGMIHRDLKPANVMIVPGEDQRPAVKVLDFGLVKRLSDVEDVSFPVANAEIGEDITQVGTFLGTPAYVAPEQALGKVADARADIYSIGVMLYRSLTGKLPFDASNSEAQILAHRTRPIPPMSERAPERHVPIALEAICRRCLEKRPDDRFADADALLLAFESLGAPGPATTSLDEPLTTIVLPEKPARRPVWIGVAVAILLASGIGFAGIVGVLVLREPAPAPVTEAPAVAPEAPPEPTTPPVVAASPESKRTLWLLLSSSPAGATILLGDRTIGVTPFADQVLVSGETGTFTLKKNGYADASIELDLTGEKASGDLPLTPLGGRRATKPDTAPKAPPQPQAEVVADDVRFTGAEAAAALAWVNTASHEAILNAGIAPQQANILVNKRPFADLAAVAQTPFIGEKTLRAIQAAAR